MVKNGLYIFITSLSMAEVYLIKGTSKINERII
jgi:hypothetical protein